MGKLTKIWLKGISKATGRNNFFLSDKSSHLLMSLLISELDAFNIFCQQQNTFQFAAVINYEITC